MSSSSQPTTPTQASETSTSFSRCSTFAITNAHQPHQPQAHNPDPDHRSRQTQHLPIPFPQSHQLTPSLCYAHHSLSSSPSPTLHTHPLTTSSQTLPDAPLTPLTTPSILTYTTTDLTTPTLNHLGPKLWYTCPTPSIRSLSTQITLGRDVIVTEDIDMHCIWSDGTVWIKPIPSYLGSWGWWVWVCDEEEGDKVKKKEVKKAALGFLRTWSMLVQRRSDWNIAVKKGLVDAFIESNPYRKGGVARLHHYQQRQQRQDFTSNPTYDSKNEKPPLPKSSSCTCQLQTPNEEDIHSDPTITFETLCIFLSHFSIDSTPHSSTLAPRWLYGELELSSLNFYSLIHLHRYHRNRWEARHGAFFQRFFPVVLFMFALFSVMLSAMQVIVAAEALKRDGREAGASAEGDGDGGAGAGAGALSKRMQGTMGIFVWFGIEAIGWSVAFGVLFVVWWIVISSMEAWKRRRTKRRWVKRWKDEEVGRANLHGD